MPASILVVDDDAPFRTAVCRVLRAAGHAVEEAADGGQAARQIAAEPPEMLITDIMMPDGDGIELIVTVRRQHPQVRILAVSGRLMMGSLSLLGLADKLGAHATLAKPISPDDLLAAVAAALA